MNYELRIKNRLGKGFTLIELLIVIVIIGVLSAILMANFVGVRQRARDAQRKSDLRQIQSALELYRADVGNYPLASPGIYSTSCPTSGPFITAAYMQKVPCDSSPNGSTYAPYGTTPNSAGNYIYTAGLSGNNNTYYLYACLENTNDNDPNIISGTECGSRDIYRLSNP
ncbi:MAG: prepilin-type N-terminal cleavage/methylation domain-containing protein [Patescibacteria group bacterium]